MIGGSASATPRWSTWLPVGIRKILPLCYSKPRPSQYPLKRINGRAAEQRSAVFSNKSEPRSDPRPSDPAYLSSPLHSPGLTAFLRPPCRAPALSMIGGSASATPRPRIDWWPGTARQHTGRSAGILSKRVVPMRRCSIPAMLAAPWLPFTKLPPQTLLAAMFVSGRANHRPLAACGPASSQLKPVLSTNSTRCNAMHPPANTLSLSPRWRRCTASTVLGPQLVYMDAGLHSEDFASLLFKARTFPIPDAMCL